MSDLLQTFFSNPSYYPNSSKQVFLKISPDLQENICAGVSVVQVQAACNFIKKRLWHRCFPVNFAEFLRPPFFAEHLQTIASELYLGLLLTQQKIRKYYQANIHQTKQQKLVGENTKMTSNYKPLAIIYDPVNR